MRTPGRATLRSASVQFRAIATDLDGTLLRDDGTVGERTRDALHRAAVAGVPVIVVTARPHRFVSEVRGLPLHGTAICANGALVVDLASGEVLHAHLLGPDAALGIVNSLRELVPGAAFAVETSDWFGHEPAYRPQWPAPAGSPIAPVETLLDRGVLKLLARRGEVSAVDAISPHFKLIALKGNVLSFYTTPDEALQLYKNNDVALIWANYGQQQVKMLQDAGLTDWVYVNPKEGALAWLDTWALSKGAQNPELAAKWVNFLLQKKIGEELSARTGFGNTVAPFASAGADDKIVWLEAVEDPTKRADLWNEIKAAP